MAEPDLVDLVTCLLASGNETVPGSALNRAAVGLLKSNGFLTEENLVTTIWCENCDDGHPARVIRHPDTGAPAIRCPDTGFEELDADQLRSFDVEYGELVLAIVSALGIPKRHRKELLPRRLWRLGPMRTDDRVIETFLLFGPAYDVSAEELNSCLSDAARDDLTILLHPFAEFPFALPGSIRPVSISDLFGVSEDLELDADYLERLVDRCLPPSSSPRPGRPGGLEATREVMKFLGERGTLPSGRNAAARAVLAAWPEVHPDGAPPKQSTLQDHVTAIRRSPLDKGGTKIDRLAGGQSPPDPPKR